MNPMQDLYLNQFGVREASVEMGDMYCQLSATLTVQEISQHYQKDQEIKQLLGRESLRLSNTCPGPDASRLKMCAAGPWFLTDV